MSKHAGDIRFKVKPDKIVECILHLAKHIDGKILDHYRVGKLIYLADMEHLNRFGRPITYDRILAMRDGPVPSFANHLLKKNAAAKKVIDYKKLPFTLDTVDGRVYVAKPQREVDMQMMSKTDIEVLDNVIREHGDKSFTELRDYTHDHPAWAKAWKNRGKKAVVSMRVEDMIANSKGKKDLIEELQFSASSIA